MTALGIGISGVLAFLLLMMLRMPIAIAMGVVGMVGFSLVNSPTAALKILSTDFYNTFSSYSLSVILMFSWMGYLAYYAGIGAQLYSFAYKAVGHFSGGLAMASQVACAIFGAVCGSSTATTATIGSIAIPEMRKYNYSDVLSTASVAAGGAIGILIPPSIVFVVYGVTTEQSITKLFLAGIIPGILLTLAYMITIWIITKRNPELGPPRPGPRPSFGELVKTLKGGIIETLIVFIITIGGLFAGIFTPTEAGAMGSAGVLAVTLVSRKMDWTKFNKSLIDTTKTASMIFFLVGGAYIFGRFIAISRLPFELAAWISELQFPPFLVMMIIILIYLVLGCIIEMIPLMLLTLPIFYPVVTNVLHYDPIWFGVIIVMVTAMGVITPPVGINAYVIKGIVPDVPLEKIFSGIWPFLVACIITTVLLIMIPQITLFLPNLLIK